MIQNLLKSIALQQFRSYASYQLVFEKPTTVIIGPNAIGKTSILEAIALVSTGSSFRATKIDQMIAFEQELSRVKAVIEEQATGELSEDEDLELEMLLTRGMVQGKRTQKRLYSVNGVRRRKKDFVGKLLTVVFRPEDLRLIEGSPSRRRTYLDMPLASLSRQYDIALSTYEKALRQRNKLLEQVRERSAPANSLHYWNQTMLKHGTVLQEQRRKFTSFINIVAFPLGFSIEYQPSVISEERIEEYQRRAIAAGHTLIGPHKDDFIVNLIPQNPKKNSPDKFDVATYGSRGQQRMAVLWLKVAEQAYLQEQTDQQPLLLLDDILSELDPDVRAKVLELLPGGQSIVTSADSTILSEIEDVVSDPQVVRLEE
jgi:DNA replication and repair protein RecF